MLSVMHRHCCSCYPAFSANVCFLRCLLPPHRNSILHFLSFLHSVSILSYHLLVQLGLLLSNMDKKKKNNLLLQQVFYKAINLLHECSSLEFSRGNKTFTRTYTNRPSCFSLVLSTTANKIR